MSTNRASLITKTHKVLKKHYQATTPPSDRTLFENLMYACCLENSPVEPADEAFAKLQEVFFDWNEVRVTTISELSEIMSSLNRASEAATRLRRVLHSVFETFYSFGDELELLKKENIGTAVKKLEKLDGMTPFCVSYVVQTSLGGHSIGVSEGVLQTLYVVGIISEKEAKKRQAPGLERAIPKTKGIEFASLLHQLGADLVGSPHSTRVRNILLEIAPDAKERLPKRTTKKVAADKSSARKVQPKKAREKTAAAKKAPAKKKVAAKPAKKKKAAPQPKKKAKAGASKKKSPTKRLARKKPR